MPIFTDDSAPPNPAAVQAVEILQRSNSALLQETLDNYRAAYARTWFSRDATPAEIFAELDANGEAHLNALQVRVDSITALAALKGETFDEQFAEGPLAAAPAYTVSGGVVTITP